MTSKYRYKKIDAFTSGGSAGNPAACLYLTAEEAQSEEEMLAIAKSHKGFVSEVVYCTTSKTGIHLTYYSSECEVEFCGHGTIACMHNLIKDDPTLLEQKEITIQTNKKGALTVYNRMQNQGIALITAPALVYSQVPFGEDVIAGQLGLNLRSLDSKLPIELIDAGLRTLIVPIADLESELSVSPNEPSLREFCIKTNIDIILVFTREVAEGNHIAHTRVFAPQFGYLEDPATGSGNSAFGYYMVKNNLWDKRDCMIEQKGKGHAFNNIYLSCRDGAVLFGGSATVRIDGVYVV